MAGSQYYDKNLSGERLGRCYQIASPRIEQYFEAEISHVLDHIRPTDIVLELGCGHGDKLGTFYVSYANDFFYHLKTSS